MKIFKMIITRTDCYTLEKQKKGHQNLTRTFASKSRRDTVLCHINLLTSCYSHLTLVSYQYDLKFIVKGQKKCSKSSSP